MLLLVQGASDTMRQLQGTQNLGILLSPGAKNSPERLVRMKFRKAADNGCFSGFVEEDFVRFLDVIVGHELLWVAAPDVVKDAMATLALFETWEPILHARGLPVALVAQDGLTIEQVPWDRIECLFIGGGDDWKLSDAAVALCREAKRHGKLVHVGRVNSFIRIRAAAAMGADSVDGSQFSWWPNRYIPKGLKWIRRAMADVGRGPCMFGTCARAQAMAAGRVKHTPGPLGPKRKRKESGEGLFNFGGAA